MENTSFDVYSHINHGTFLIPKVDRILDREAMLNSAENSPNTVRIIETEASSHFITLDSQEWLPSLDVISEARMQAAQ